MRSVHTDMCIWFYGWLGNSVQNLIILIHRSIPMIDIEFNRDTEWFNTKQYHIQHDSNKRRT